VVCIGEISHTMTDGPCSARFSGIVLRVYEYLAVGNSNAVDKPLGY